MALYEKIHKSLLTKTKKYKFQMSELRNKLVKKYETYN